MAEPLKNAYNRAYVKRLCDVIMEICGDQFDSGAFVSDVFDHQWGALELKQRMRRLSDCLAQHLPGAYPKQLQVVCQIAPEFGGYEAMFLPGFVEIYGLSHWDISVKALALLTQYSSSEFAVRPYIEAESKDMMATMLAWSKSDNDHIRRLASEGCRPRLPWASALPAFKKDPTPIIPILEQLKEDPSEYVRRSVANNLNDISKDHPGLVIELTQAWSRRNTPETNWVVKHALRTLLKAGHPEALKVLGYAVPPIVTITRPQLTETTVELGKSLTFSCEIKSTTQRSQKLMIDYVIEHKKAGGHLTEKVFKLSTRALAAGETLRIERTHPFRRISTRTYHSGEHRIAIQVNGMRSTFASFELEVWGHTHDTAPQTWAQKKGAEAPRAFVF